MANGAHPKKANGSYCAPGRVPQSIIEQEAKEKGTTYRGNEEDCAKLARIEARQKEKTEEQWMPVQGSFPRLVFKTQEKRKMDDFTAPDMVYHDEDRTIIEGYGWLHPFKQSKPIYFHKSGYAIQDEDQFTLPAAEHFKRMRGLGEYFSITGKTKGLFSKMVDKFERSEGGYYTHPLLDDALRDHDSTAHFHSVLKQCLAENIKEGVLDKDIVSLSSNYMAGKTSNSHGAGLPKFDASIIPLPSKDLLNGTVLTVHDIWAMNVYVEKLEYKGDLVRGIFKYEIQDHFGLDSADINHEHMGGLPFEKLEGFRSWYLLQHFKGYGYQPFITQIRFKL